MVPKPTGMTIFGLLVSAAALVFCQQELRADHQGRAEGVLVTGTVAALDCRIDAEGDELCQDIIGVVDRSGGHRRLRTGINTNVNVALHERYDVLFSPSTEGPARLVGTFRRAPVAALLLVAIAFFFMSSIGLLKSTTPLKSSGDRVQPPKGGPFSAKARVMAAAAFCAALYSHDWSDFPGELVAFGVVLGGLFWVIQRRSVGLRGNAVSSVLGTLIVAAAHLLPERSALGISFATLFALLYLGATQSPFVDGFLRWREERRLPRLTVHPGEAFDGVVPILLDGTQHAYALASFAETAAGKPLSDLQWETKNHKGAGYRDGDAYEVLISATVHPGISRERLRALLCVAVVPSMFLIALASSALPFPRPALDLRLGALPTEPQQWPTRLDGAPCLLTAAPENAFCRGKLRCDDTIVYEGEGQCSDGTDGLAGYIDLSWADRDGATLQFYRDQPSAFVPNHYMDAKSGRTRWFSPRTEPAPEALPD